MALTVEGSKAIYLEELAKEMTIVDAAIAEKFAIVFANSVNRIILEEAEVNAGSFTTSTGAVSGQGELA